MQTTAKKGEDFKLSEKLLSCSSTSVAKNFEMIFR